MINRSWKTRDGNFVIPGWDPNQIGGPITGVSGSGVAGGSGTQSETVTVGFNPPGPTTPTNPPLYVCLTQGPNFGLWVFTGGQWVHQASNGGGGVSAPIDLSSQCNGTLTSFALGAPPVTGSLVFWNGAIQELTTHYTIAGQTLNTVFVPQTGDTLVVYLF